MEQLFRVPDGLGDEYLATELDPTWDPFGIELRLGPHAPEGEDPGWDVDVDLASRTFTLHGPGGTIPNDLDDALALLAPYRFEEVRRTRDDDEIRIEGVVVGGHD